MSESGIDHGPDLCIAMCGDYQCEGFNGHECPHFALGGDIEWTGGSVPRYAGTGSEEADRHV